MNEIKQIDRILTGQESFNFAHMGTGTDDRRNSPYTWGDLFMNMNDAPFNTDTAVVVTSWAGHLGWLKATLTSYRNSGAYVVLSYDNYSYIWENLDAPEVIHQKLPRPLHTLLAHSFVMKHKTYDADKRIGWFWNVKYALAIVSAFPNIKYLYCTNGDCIWEKPEGLQEIKDMLGDGDFISGQSEKNNTIHTACVLYKVDALKKIVDYMTTRICPMVIAGQSPETMLANAVKILDLKEVMAPEQPRLPTGEIDWYCTLNLPSTWKSVLGFRNLYAEQEHRTNNRMEQLHPKYMDNFNNWCYFNPAEREMLCKYYDTMDRRWLLMWWDRNCNSCEDRVYHPLEFYGTEPIKESGEKWA
jgi:hypothetical protein